MSIGKTFFERLFKKDSEEKFNKEDVEALLEAYNMVLNREGQTMNQDFYELYKDLKAENRIIANKVDTTKWLLTILISVFGLFTPIMFNLHAKSIDSQMATINKTIEASHQETKNEIKLLRNDFQNLKELNKVEIEKEVLKHTK